MKEQQVSVVAMECLHKAKTYKQSDNKVLFYEEIAKATSGYLQQKYNIPNISADFEILIKNMEHNNIPTSLISIFTEIQKNCHLARFAGVYGDMENVYRKSTQWITKMEKIEYETIS